MLTSSSFCRIGITPIRRLLDLRVATIALTALQLSGCAGNTIHGDQTGPPVAPAILHQPADQSVPMGLTATYTVSASGYPLSYQWNENGTPISGATSTTYATPVTAFTDTGSTFTVNISNSLGSVTSTPAKLTVTARAPKAGDLRFQQVDAASTVNGYDNGPVGISSNIPSRGGAYFGLSIGSPLFMSTINCVPPPVPLGDGCDWLYEQFNLPDNLLELGLSTGYGGDFFTNFEADLQSNSFPALGSALDAPNSVITSLDLESADDLFAVSWIQSSHVSGFDTAQKTVAPGGFQAAATQEGANSRVITAVSYNAGQVVYLSYGWQSDTSTVYEAQVATASVETAATVAANLAAQGYIITAIGGSDLSDSFFLVGTRIRGDTMPRPFVIASEISGTSAYTALMQPGYAMVGVLEDSQGNLTFLGER